MGTGVLRIVTPPGTSLNQEFVMVLTRVDEMSVAAAAAPAASDMTIRARMMTLPAKNERRTRRKPLRT